MNVRLCIVSVLPDLFQKSVGHALSSARGSVSVVGLGNGVELTMPPEFQETEHILRHSAANQGVPAALHDLWNMSLTAWPEPSNEEILCFIHDDLYILEAGWDERVKKVFENDPRCGLAGFGGATAYGRSDIYKSPYEWQQVGRQDFWSNMHGAETHGNRTTAERPIVFTDGYSMIIRRPLLDKIDGWSALPHYYVHYGYDCFIACMARRHGFSAWLVPCEVVHGDEGGWGAATRARSDYTTLADKFGGDQHVMMGVHKFLYNEFRDVLPLKLP